MRDDHFEAVTIETGDVGRHANITNIRQIAERLTAQWPVAHKGAAYRKAVKACMDHLRGKKDARGVRDASSARRRKRISSCEKERATNDETRRDQLGGIACRSPAWSFRAIFRLRSSRATAMRLSVSSISLRASLAAMYRRSSPNTCATCLAEDAF
jgi:hypothetical protein